MLFVSDSSKYKLCDGCCIVILCTTLFTLYVARKDILVIS